MRSENIRFIYSCRPQRCSRILKYRINIPALINNIAESITKLFYNNDFI